MVVPSVLKITSSRGAQFLLDLGGCTTRFATGFAGAMTNIVSFLCHCLETKDRVHCARSSDARPARSEQKKACVRTKSSYDEPRNQYDCA